jgi:hypothetical protein
MTMAGVPPGVVAEHKPYLSNMLGLIRGNIYYNLMSWYRCLTCLPVGDTSKYMETMMGVKQVKIKGIHVYLKLMILCCKYRKAFLCASFCLYESCHTLQCMKFLIIQEARFDWFV